MTSSLLTLPPEMRLEIFKCCTEDDWPKISLCCKELHKDVTPLLWHELSVYSIDLGDDFLAEIGNVKYTADLTFYGNGKETDEREDDFNHFRSLIARCNAQMIKKFEFEDHSTNDGLRLVAKELPNIEWLGLFQTTLGTRNRSYITKFMFVVTLTIFDCDVTDSDFRKVGKLPNLNCLEVDSCAEVTKKFLNYCSRAPCLSKLNYVAFLSIDDDYDEPLEIFNSLRELRLDCLMRNHLFSNAENKLKMLSVLKVGSCDMHDDVIFNISKIALLEELQIDYCPEITSESLAYISTMTSLKKLAILYSIDLTDQGLIHLTNMNSLQELNLSHSKGFTDAGLLYLSVAPALKKLIIDSCKYFTNVGLKYVSQIQTLKALSIRSGKFTDEGLCYLKALKNLEEFAFGGDVTKYGVAKAGLPEHSTAWTEWKSDSYV